MSTKQEERLKVLFAQRVEIDLEISELQSYDYAQQSQIYSLASVRLKDAIALLQTAEDYEAQRGDVDLDYENIREKASEALDAVQLKLEQLQEAHARQLDNPKRR